MTAMPPIWTNTATLDGFIDGLETSAGVAEAEVALIGSKTLPVDDMPHLRGIFRCGVGTDNIPLETCRARGIAVRMPSDETVAVIHEETANFAVHLVLKSLYRHIGDLQAWVKEPRPCLSERRVLVVGTGRIGSRVVAKLAPLVQVETWDIADDPLDRLEAILPTVDCVTLHVPLDESTRGWVDAQFLARMQDGAALVNTARGPIVDEQALLAQVQQGRLFAAFDVFWTEPYTGPLRDHHPQGFLMSPHVASTSTTFLRALSREFRVFLDECACVEVHT